jgi:hypothetical protein
VDSEAQMDGLDRTRRSLHGIAELIMAGPQLARSGTIHLRATAGGFGTVADPDLRMDGVDLVAGDRRLPTPARTPRALADDLGLAVGAPGVYSDGSGVAADDVLELSAAAAGEIAEAYANGHAALTELTPGQTPVLWPEHFDIATTMGRVNYGVSPGDGYLDHPYAYVGPWDPPPAGAFWNAPFGAARPLRELADARAVLAFFQDGAALL